MRATELSDIFEKDFFFSNYIIFFSKVIRTFRGRYFLRQGIYPNDLKLKLIDFDRKK